MALTKDEEDFVKELKRKSDLQTQIDNKYTELWQKVDAIMINNTDGTQWEKRRAEKVKYFEEIKALKDQL